MMASMLACRRSNMRAVSSNSLVVIDGFASSVAAGLSSLPGGGGGEEGPGDSSAVHPTPTPSSWACSAPTSPPSVLIRDRWAKKTSVSARELGPSCLVVVEGEKFECVGEETRVVFPWMVSIRSRMDASATECSFVGRGIRGLLLAAEGIGVVVRGGGECVLRLGSRWL